MNEKRPAELRLEWSAWAPRKPWGLWPTDGGPCFKRFDSPELAYAWLQRYGYAV